jgi:hypothetical protein
VLKGAENLPAHKTKKNITLALLEKYTRFNVSGKMYQIQCFREKCSRFNVSEKMYQILNQCFWKNVSDSMFLEKYTRFNEQTEQSVKETNEAGFQNLGDLVKTFFYPTDTPV